MLHFADMKELSANEISLIKNEFPCQVGNRIKELRKKQGITQTKLANLTDKDRQYIFKIEKGLVTPNIATIKIIANALDISLNHFFTDL